MTDLKVRLSKRRLELLREIENAAEAGESKKFPGLVSELERVEAVIAKHEAVVEEAVSLLGADATRRTPSYLGKGLEVLRGSVGPLRGG